MKTIRVATLLIVLLAAPSVSHSADRSSPKISADDAWRLASTYMLFHISGCGGMGAPVARGDYWDVPVRFGITGDPRGAVRVHMRTGTASYRWRGQSYPTRSPAQLAEEERRFISRGRKA